MFVPIDDRKYEALCDDWLTSIISKPCGKSFSTEFYTDNLNKMWKPNAAITSYPIGKGFFITKFRHHKDLDRVLSAGCALHWFLNGTFISVERWKLGFKPSNAPSNRSTIWVELPELPAELNNQAMLTNIGNSISIFVKKRYLRRFMSKEFWDHIVACPHNRDCSPDSARSGEHRSNVHKPENRGSHEPKGVVAGTSAISSGCDPDVRALGILPKWWINELQKKFGDGDAMGAPTVVRFGAHSSKRKKNLIDYKRLASGSVRCWNKQCKMASPHMGSDPNPVALRLGEEEKLQLGNVGHQNQENTLEKFSHYSG
uniref:DUF4283 domain-containing protein n=1 Tax=Chenopodium quinoa TaxID=63459 RepID=A0A803MBP0_CHEQI